MSYYEGNKLSKLLGGIKKLKIDDQDSSTPDRLKNAFPQHWISSGGRSMTAGGVVTLYSDLNMTEEKIACGLSNGEIIMVDADNAVIPRKKGGRYHEGLSCLVCSHTSPSLVYSGSSTDGLACLWDFRVSDNNSPVLKYSIGSSKIGGDVSSTSSKIRPILSLDLSCGDQVLCAGTELVDEDSFILLWDVRLVRGGGASSVPLLGAYWESHSDDVTSVQFHPEKYNLLSTGSTDGLVNVFDLNKEKEEDALLFSFNTESSVESLHWSKTKKEEGKEETSCITVLTHGNEVQMWDAEGGDKIGDFDRAKIAQGMMRSNPEAVYVNGCYPKRNKKGPLGLLTSSLKGSCTRFLEIKGTKLEASGLFLDNNSIVQTAQFISKSNKWITFDEEGAIKTWTLKNQQDEEESPKPAKKRKIK